MTLTETERRTHWPSVLQFVVSGIALTAFWGGGLSAFIYGLFGLAYSGGTALGPQETLLVSVALFALGAFLLPSLLYSLVRLSDRPFPEIKLFNRLKARFPRSFFVLLALIVIGGATALQLNAWYLLPFFHVLAATLPAIWLIWLALRRLSIGNDQRKWATLTSGLTAGPMIAILVEGIFAFFLVIIGLIYISSDPEFARALEQLQRSLESVGPNEQVLASFLEVLLTKPLLIILLFIQLSIITPLIEELVKPLAVWILSFRGPISPAAGFGLGVISGAGLAIIENLINGATFDGWTSTTVIRFGATAFHLATSGLMGWAIVRAKNQKKYLQLFATYLLVVVVHGIWNAAALTAAGAAIYTASASSGTPSTLLYVAGAVFVLIGGLCVTLIWRLNKRSQTNQAKIAALPEAG